MKKYISLFFSLSLFLYACKSNKVPGEFIDRPQMTALLTELHVIDGGLYGVRQMPDSLFKYGAGRYQSLFKKYGTDSIQFRKSLAYYTTQPPLMQAIYVDILKNLQLQTDSVNKLQVANNRIMDSLNRIKAQKTADSLNKIQKKFNAADAKP